MSSPIDATRQSLQLAHQLCSMMVAGLPADAAVRRFPETKMNAIAPTIAHAAFGEDFMVNQLIMRREPLLTRGDWLRRTGIPDANATLSPEWAAAQYDWDVLLQYTAALFAETDHLLGELMPADLAHPVATPFGTEMPALDFLAMFPAVHLSSHVGEVAALKGALGMTGYPM